MSQLPTTDLSSAVAGSTGSLDWSTYGLPTGQPGAKGPKLQLFNESGCGLDIRLISSGRTFSLPAGGWIQGGVDLLPQDKGLTYTVAYVIPNAPVAQLVAVYWPVGETPPAIALGNSPIGITGSVTTSSIQTLKNDGQTPGTVVVETTPSDQASSSLSLANDGSGFWQVLSAGVLRKLLNLVRGNASSGKATFTIGDSGDATITTVYGSVLGGQPATVGALTSGAVTSSGVVTGTELVANPTGVGGGTPTMLDLKPVGATVNKEWIILFNGLTGGIQFFNVTDGINAFSITAAGGLAVSQTLSVAGGETISAGGLAVTAGGITQAGNTTPYTKSNGGGAAGGVIWEGTTDPAGSAAEGDLWIAA